MKKILPCLFLICSSLSAEAPPPASSSVSSTKASYDGSALTLSGHVTLDHGFGKMSAEEAILERQESGKEFPFSLIHLRSGVAITLPTKAELLCDKADLDFSDLKGILSSEEGNKVVYKDVLKKKKGAPSSFRLMGRSIHLGVAKKEAQNGKKMDYDIQTVLAKEEVVLECPDLFTLYADHALYRKESNASKEFQGIISAYPKDSTSSCRLVHLNDIIDAASIDVDLIHSKLSFYQPKGTLFSLLTPQKQQGEIHFSSDLLIFEHLKDLLSLKGHVRIFDTVLGTLSSDEEVQIIQDKKKNLKKISCLGKTELVYANNHKLISYGHLVLDHERLSVLIDNPPGKQLYYEEEQMGTYADLASVEYAMVDGVFQPVSLTLKGNISLFSKDPKAARRCALADRVSYSPSSRTLILAAEPGKKVLFWDEGQSIKMAAPEVHITKDTKSDQDMVKGVGTVQFSLNSEESKKLKELFPFFEEDTHE